MGRIIAVAQHKGGTGKTTTVARILALAARMHAGTDFRIRLAAPTGKAASRMSEALAKAFPGGTLPPDLDAAAAAAALRHGLE